MNDEQERAAALADKFETLGLGIAVQVMRPAQRKATEEFLISLLRGLDARPAVPDLVSEETMTEDGPRVIGVPRERPAIPDDLREAVAPFAKEAETAEGQLVAQGFRNPDSTSRAHWNFSWGDLRRAREAIKETDHG